MGARRQKRVKTVLPVRLGWMDSAGNPFMAMAHTIDISNSGVRVGGVVALLTQGSTIELQYRHRKAKFEITWVRGGTEQQLGLRALEPTKNIWGASLDASEFQDDYEAPKKPTPVTSTRTAPRFQANASVDLVTVPEHRSLSAELQNVSSGGCYLRSFAPLESGTKAELLIQMDGLRVNAFGIVRSSHAGQGMGVKFTGFRTPEDELALNSKLAELAGEEVKPKRRKQHSELAERLQKVTKELYDVEELIKAAVVEPEILREFREAVGQVRSTSWAVQKFFELEEGKSSEDVLAFLNTERIRLATRLCEHLCADLKRQEVDRQSPHLAALLETVEDLFTRLAGFEFKMVDLGARRRGAGR
jgi:hypothetical protein